MNCRALISVAAMAVLAGCVDYREEWRFEPGGAGRVRIECQPSAAWRAAHEADEWHAAAKLFMPPFHSLSQVCARAGVRIERCRFEYRARRGVPRMELVLAFDTLQQIARCGLFAERELQWRRSGGVVTLLHRLHAYPSHITPPRDGLMHPAWFADGSVTVDTYMPGRVLRAEGALRKGRVVTASTTLNDMARGEGIVMLLQARVRHPWWWWAVCALAAVVCASMLAWLVFTRMRRRAWRVE